MKILILILLFVLNLSAFELGYFEPFERGEEKKFICFNVSNSCDEITSRIYYDLCITIGNESFLCWENDMIVFLKNFFGGKMDKLEKRLLNLLSEQTGHEEKDLKPEQNLIDDLGMDSLDSVEIIMAIEEEFDIEIPDTDGDKLHTVKDFIDYVKKNT